jgi:phospholipid/cholesterol/gamma-HCH transport system substrate-binding protein
MNLSNEIKAGLFVVVSLGLLVLSVFVMGRERQIFATQSEFLAAFRDIKGLAPGAPVRLGGISIGRVDRVMFAEQVEDPNVHVHLLVNDEFLERVRSDSVVTIETQGLLGDRFINISSGSRGELSTPGSYLRTEESGDMAQILAKAQRVVDKTVEIADNVNSLLKDFNTSALPEIKDGASAIKDISRQIRDGDGFVHRLIYSKKDGDEILSSLEATSKNISEIVAGVRHGDGLLHALIFKPGGDGAVQSLIDASQKLGTLAESLNALSDGIRNGEGLLHDLIFSSSTKGLDEILKNLAQMSEHLRKASQALAQGSGTLGALLVDPQLYNNLVEITDETKRSFLLREAIRSSIGK